MSHLDVVRQSAGSVDSSEVGTLFCVPPGEASLAIGAPGPDLLKRSMTLIQGAMNNLVQEPNAHNFWQYGPIRGDAALLNAIASFVSARYNGDAVNPESLAITSGASSALLFLCTYFGSRSSSKLVFLEDPCYFLASSVVRDCGLTGVGVASDSDGLSVDGLRAALLAAGLTPVSVADSATANYAALVYTIPDFCNPTGRVMSLERRHALVALAAEFNLLVICDDIYTMLNYGDRALLPPRVKSLDKSAKGHVVSSGSFSKILAPGVRVGWVEAGPFVIRAFDHSGFCVSGGCPNQLASGVLRNLLKSGEMDKHIDFLRSTFTDRKQRMVQAMRETWPAQVTFTEPYGGFFIWCELPAGRNAADLLAMCKSQCHVGFVAGALTSVSGGSTNFFRLTFAYYPADELVRHVSAIGEQLHRFLE